jgi:hypothetical protein
MTAISVRLLHGSRAEVKTVLTPTTSLVELVGTLSALFGADAPTTGVCDVLVHNQATREHIGWLSESTVSPYDTHAGCVLEDIVPAYFFGLRDDGNTAKSATAAAGAGSASARASVGEDVSSSSNRGDVDLSGDDDDDDDDDDGSSDTSDVDASSDEDLHDDDGVTDIEELRLRLRKVRLQLKEATVTIGALVHQYSGYRNEVEQQLKRTEDRSRVERQEAIGNLQTLMTELEAIEGRNAALHEELETERQEHQASLHELEQLRKDSTATGAAIAAPASNKAVAFAAPVPSSGKRGSFLRRGVDISASSPRSAQQALIELAGLVRQMNAVLGEVDSSGSPPPPAVEGAPASAEVGTVQASESLSRIKQTISLLQEQPKSSSFSKRGTLKLTTPRRRDTDLSVQLPPIQRSAVLGAVLVGDVVWLSLGDCSIVVLSCATCQQVAVWPRRDVDPLASPIPLLRAHGDSVWASTSTGAVLVLDAKSGATRHTWHAHPKKLADLVVVEDVGTTAAASVWTCCSADMLLKTWTPDGVLAREQQLPNLMLSILNHAGLLWVGTESSILRFQTQPPYGRLDALRRLNGESLHGANLLVSCGEDVFAACDDGTVAQFAVHGECLRHIASGSRLTAMSVVDGRLWLGCAGGIRLLSRNGEWLRADLRFPTGVDAVLAILPVEAQIDGPRVALTATIDGQLLAWKAPDAKQLEPAAPAAPAKKQAKAARKVSKAATKAAAAAAAPAAASSTAAAHSALLTGDVQEAVRLLSKQRSLLAVGGKKDDVSKVVTASARELCAWFERLVGSRADAVALGSRLLQGGKLKAHEHADAEFADNEALWTLDMRSDNVLTRLFRKKKPEDSSSKRLLSLVSPTSPAAASSEPPPAGLSMAKSKQAIAIAADFRGADGDAGDAEDTLRRAVSSPVSGSPLAERKGDDDKVRKSRPSRWSHKLRVFLPNSIVSETLSVRDSTTLPALLRELVSKFELREAPENLALVVVVDGEAVCTLSEPLRASLRFRRENQRFELWTVPPDDGKYEPDAAAVSNRAPPELLRAAHVGERPTVRPLIPPTHVVCMHDFVADAEDEVSLKRRDIVRVLNRGADGDWWFGVSAGGETGLFPSSFSNGVASPKKEEKGEKETSSPSPGVRSRSQTVV